MKNTSFIGISEQIFYLKIVLSSKTLPEGVNTNCSLASRVLNK